MAHTSYKGWAPRSTATMSTWGCHAAMLRTLERQPPADEALVGPQASVVRRKKLSRTSQLLTSGLLDSALDEVQPLRKMKRALADERARRRRHEVAQREPTIFDAFAIHEGVEDLVIESDPPGLKTTRWLEAPDAKALRENKDAALDRAIQKLEKAAVFFARGSGFDGWSGPKGLLKPSAAFVAFEGAEFLKTDVKRRIRISTNCHLTTSEANAFADHFEVDEKYFDGPRFVQWFFAQGYRLRMVELNRLQAVAEKERQEAVEKFNRSSSEDLRERYKVVTAPFTEEDEASARKKLREAASNRGLVGDVAARRSFGGTMTPAELRDQLKKSYKLSMTPQEMGAVFSAFDKSARTGAEGGDGCIDSTEFTYGWATFMEDARNVERSANEKALALRKVLHEPPSMDTLEEGSVDLKASFVALHDGAARKKDAVRLTFKGGYRPSKHRGKDSYSMVRERKAREELGLDALEVPHVQRRPSSLVLSPCVKPRPLVRPRSILKEQTTPTRGRLATNAIAPRRTSTFRRPTTSELEATATPKTGRRRLSSSSDAVGFHGGNLDLPVDRTVGARRQVTIHRPRTPFDSRANEALLSPARPD